VPPSSMGMPIISIYLLSVAALTTFSLIGNTLVLNLYGKDVELQKDMPKWVYLAKYISLILNIIK